MDRYTQQILREAPPHARVGEALEQACSELPLEVYDFFRSAGTSVASAELLKISFHATFLVNLSTPLQCDGQLFATAIVQVVGVTCNDKAFWCELTARTLAKAHELAATAGLRVPKVFGTGKCYVPLLGDLDFIVQEFITTHTVEDKVRAPNHQWCAIVDGVKRTLKSRPLPIPQECEPLPHFESVEAHLTWLLNRTPAWNRDLQDALRFFLKEVQLSPPPPEAPVLLHQDLNGGNVLCSEVSPNTDKWALDAIIDWESAVVADPRSLDRVEPFKTARTFALVVKAAELADCLARECLPLCELEELVENFNEAAEELHAKNRLKCVTFADLVSSARLHAGWTETQLIQVRARS
mmetsp:Transcript_15532/g.33713  ORF Transcript_15532/g.33713 Transcript_15532/m.33713 type:complete len:353 (-) Transcript_15532:198-1256(-)